MTEPLPVFASDAERLARYAEVRAAIASLLEDQSDWVSAMATVAAELHHAFAYFHWTGFYRAVKPDLLLVGPYQGGHGCISIAVPRGVCGAAAQTRTPQLVPDVHAFPDHIPCSATTRSEVVVPIVSPAGRLLGVIDVDSDHPSAFSEVDTAELLAVADDLGERYGDAPAL